MLTFAAARLGRLPVVECRYPLRANHEPMKGFDRIYLHNTYKHSDLSDLLAFSLGRGFAGIGYHFAIHPDGTIYSTRPLDVQGAHTLGKNQHSVGVVLLHADKCASSSPALAAFYALRSELSSRAGISLPVLSHTFGQFEHLNDLIERYNGLVGTSGMPLSDVGMDVCDHGPFSVAREAISRAIDAQFQRGVQRAFAEPFQRVVSMFHLLKLCPGPSYLRVMEAGQRYSGGNDGR
ncbi:MAG: peptidoglycan recognition family protein [Candidatus Woesearchaeota archaeon]|nr:peptidoglycan recognition family protein [Candidatus Woesearchaeota archaeon]